MKLWKILGVELYEVGDIFLNMSGKNPGLRFKGTWKLIAKGQTLVGVDTSQSEFNSVRKSGGAKTHTLTVAQIPSHTHSFSAVRTFDYGQPNGTGYYRSATVNSSGTTGGAGSGNAHNNLQPYLTTYIWERVS